jgi:hypothetical protein
MKKIIKIDNKKIIKVNKYYLINFEEKNFKSG